jgi:hypothetical protein
VTVDDGGIGAGFEDQPSHLAIVPIQGREQGIEPALVIPGINVRTVLDQQSNDIQHQFRRPIMLNLLDGGLERIPSGRLREGFVRIGPLGQQ